MRQEMNCNSERGGGDGREDDGSNARGRGFTDVGVGTRGGSEVADRLLLFTFDSFDKLVPDPQQKHVTVILK